MSRTAKDEKLGLKELVAIGVGGMVGGKPGDYLLIGFDLKKDIEILNKAYNDSENITAQFHLNLLRRINRELGGNFNPD